MLDLIINLLSTCQLLTKNIYNTLWIILTMQWWGLEHDCCGQLRNKSVTCYLNYQANLNSISKDIGCIYFKKLMYYKLNTP